MDFPIADAFTDSLSNVTSNAQRSYNCQLKLCRNPAGTSARLFLLTHELFLKVQVAMLPKN